MTTQKDFIIKEENVARLIRSIGGCMATDKITAQGELVDFMYREQPDFEADSGWRFLSGTETQEYADNPDNWAIYDTNTIANYDKGIIPYLDLPIGSELERVKETDEFRSITA